MRTLLNELRPRRFAQAKDRTGTWQVWKMPPEGGQAVQVTKKGGFAAFEFPDGKTLYYAKVSIPKL